MPTGKGVANREGEYEFDLGGAFPVDRVVLELATPNSIVPATLSARASTGEPWQPVGSTVFYRLDQPDGSITSPPFPVAVGERRYWLLRIDPRSGVTGPAPPPMRAGWQPRGDRIRSARPRPVYACLRQSSGECGGAADRDAGARIRKRKGCRGRICGRANGRSDRAWRTGPAETASGRAAVGAVGGSRAGRIDAGLDGVATFARDGCISKDRRIEITRAAARLMFGGGQHAAARSDRLRCAMKSSQSVCYIERGHPRPP